MKRVLLDECLPKKLKRLLPEFEVHTVQEAGWSSLRNGELFKMIPGRFDVFLTVDRNMVYQQNLSNLPFAVVVVALPENRLEHFLSILPQLKTALAASKAGDVVHIRAPEPRA